MTRPAGTVPKSRWSRKKRWVVGISGGLTGLIMLIGGAIGVYVATFDINDHIEEISAEISAELGRKVEIRGRIGGRVLSLRPQLILHDVRVANAAWGSQPHMAVVKRVRAKLRISDLLRRNVVIERIELIDATILLETDAAGRGNWLLQETADPTGTEIDDPVFYRNMTIINTKVVLKASAGAKPDVVELARVVVRTHPRTSASRFVGVGKFNGLLLDIAADLGSFDRLIAGNLTPLALKMKVGRENVSLDLKIGVADRLTIHGAMAFNNLNLTEWDPDTGHSAGLVSAAMFRKLVPFLDIELDIDGKGVTVGRKRLDILKGRFRIADQRLTVDDLVVTSGRSDLAGTVALELRDTVNGIAKLQSRRIYVPDIERLLARRGRKPSKPTAGLAGYTRYDIRVGLRIGLLRFRDWDTRQVSATVQASHRGTLIKPLDLRFPSGRARGSIALSSAMATRYDLTVSLGGPGFRLVGTTGPLRAYFAGRPTRLRFTARWAKSDLTADLTINAATPHIVSGTMRSKRIVLGDPAEKRRVSLEKTIKTPIPFRIFDGFAGRVQFRVDTLQIRGTPISGFQGTLRLGEKRISLKPLGASLIGGKLTGWGRADWSGTVPRVGLDLALTRAKVARISPGLKGDTSATDVHAGVTLHSRGKTFFDLVGNVNGNMTAILGSLDARDDVQALDELGTGLLSALVNFGALQGGKVHCVVAAFDFRNGLGRSKLLMIETESLTLFGRGSVNLRNWTANVVMLPQTKTIVVRHLTPGAVVFSGPIDTARPRMEIGGTADAALQGVFRAAADPLAMIGLALGVKPELEFRTRPCPVAVKQGVAIFKAASKKGAGATGK